MCTPARPKGPFALTLDGCVHEALALALRCLEGLQRRVGGSCGRVHSRHLVAPCHLFGLQLSCLFACLAANELALRLVRRPALAKRPAGSRSGGQAW